MKSLGFYPANVLLPDGVDLKKWSVVACDQYTSQPAYWQEVEEIVGEAPSTLRMIVPELYLEEPGVQQRIEAVTGILQKDSSARWTTLSMCAGPFETEKYAEV